MAGGSDLIWSARGTTPGEIDAALRSMLAEHNAKQPTYVPARVLNMVCVVDRRWQGEIANRLRRLDRYHASRTIVCAVEPGRTTIDAMATITAEDQPHVGDFSLLRETVTVDVGERHVPHLDTIVDPLVVTDLPTVLWAPHGHPAAVQALLPLVQVVLLDSIDDPDLRAALHRACELLERAYVVDLAWLRSTPWRERVAATFDSPPLRSDLRTITAVTVRHHAWSAVAGLLFVGWLASRLEWRLSPLLRRDGEMVGTAHARRQDVRITLDPVQQLVRGLAGLTVETASGRSLSLDRGPGGLQAHERDAKGDERRWTVLGASRGEAGVLGEGIRQALLRDPIYGLAARAASTLAGGA
jgi:glucose-6-phosphate dehydrogenase assembly protein OpcA